MNATMKKIYFSFVVSLFTVQAIAQTDNRGTDFWVCFPQNAKHEAFAGLNFRLYITGDKAAKGVVTGLGNLRREFSIVAGEILPVEIDTSAQIFGSDEIQKLAIHVQCDQPVAVYGLSNRRAST